MQIENVTHQLALLVIKHEVHIIMNLNIKNHKALMSGKDFTNMKIAQKSN
jgi:hypothetical protein